MSIAIVVIAYNRVDSLTRLLSSLSSAYYGGQNVPLVISIDKSKTDAVEKFADDFVWAFGPKTVIKHKENMGLRNHILSQGELFNCYDALIILEDDLVVSKSFFYYSQQTVSKYSNDSSIGGISLYAYSVNYETSFPFTPVKDENDVFFLNCAMSWGEIWLKDQWQSFYEWYKLNQVFLPSDDIPEQIMRWNSKSWLKYHSRYCIEQKKYFVFPYVSLTTNCSEIGTHNNSVSSVYQVPLQLGEKEAYRLPDFNGNSIRYDSFFENEALYHHLGLSEDELCIDINGKKNNRKGQRYWLTTKKMDYPIVKSFGLSYRPIEMNVFEGVEGSDIFLYDTSNSKNKRGKSNKAVLLYLYHLDNIFNLIKPYSLKKTFGDLLKKIKTKLL